ncbi:lectin-like domain-containing protein [Lactiplantibacillus modestisalitolerans]|uniref:Cell surface protein n=1 Tax=Lactiplantibacillus modestisalitolerans TaxID=1457219 RepID=A0ABV5WSQ3_9LACO|nr:cell surface protein [Lactiplantibacillus modestisalitolerans]
MRQVPKRILTMITLLVGLGLGLPHAFAEDSAVSTSLATAPSGLNQLEQLFTVPGTFSNGIANSAKIADATNPDAPNTQVVQVVGSKKQLGGFWSNDANRINLNQDTTLKAWLFLGSSLSATKSAGDGMAFVMQNDSNATTAAAQLKPGSIIGETLGTWGVDTDNKRKDPQAIAATAIQNSWALEFDTYANNSTSYGDAGNGTSFDKGVKTQHIATGYPGEASTYNSEVQKSWDLTGLIWSTRYYFSQNHDNLVTNLNLGTGGWHHLVLQWSAANQTMTYTFDDVHPDGSNNPAAITKTTPIDPSVFKTSDGLVRWGFMGATGSNTSANMVVIESVPNLVQAEADVTVTDTTKQTVVKDGAKVKAKHGLRYDYQLNYLGGQQAWDNVVADLNLPANVTFDQAVIKYANGQEQALTAPAADATSVTYTLDHALAADNESATITLTGKADDVSVNSPTTAPTSTFKNKSFETTASAPDFTITVDQAIELFILKSEYTASKGDDVRVTGLVIAEDSVQLKNSDITIHPTLNGEKLTAFQMSDADESGFFSLTIKGDQLNVGANDLRLWAVDVDDNESPEARTKITVKSGELGFKAVATNSSFKPITLDGNAQLTDRHDDWELVVSDERGKGGAWQLQASVSDFKNAAGQKLPGDVLFKQDGQTTVLSAIGAVIAERQTTSDTDEVDVAGQWRADDGLLYRSNAGATPGDYSGTITWTLNNAPS